MPSHEINFDGLVGPTHNYAGLSWGNVASMKHANSVSNPKQAALEGLEKMKFLASLGVKQAVLPPHERPCVAMLRRLGFSGSDDGVLTTARDRNPTLLAAVSSSSAMWAANAATVSPSVDSSDGKVHFTPANLISAFHRSLEADTTARVLGQIFSDEVHFAHHAPLPRTMNFADEGAANHTRLWFGDDRPGIQVFTYGRDGESSSATAETKFPARQTLLASQAIARLHRLAPMTMFFKQTPLAIDAGAFHNDVVVVGHRDVLLIHESAWELQRVALRQIAEVFEMVCGSKLHIIEIAESQLSLADAIGTYLFNSQIVSLPEDSLALIAPIECLEHVSTKRVIQKIVSGKNPISTVHFVDVRQSMRNGGGPACLRLRVMLNDRELAAMHQGVLLTDSLYESLKKWIERHYRDHLSTADLSDAKLLDESRAALSELTKILDLSGLYSFQTHPRT